LIQLTFIMNDKTHIQISMVITCVVMLFLFIMSCEAVESLEPVSGAEGMLVVSGEWPDSVKGITVVALSKLDINNLAENFIDFSDVLEPENDTLRYFIQLSKGANSLVPVGIKLEPALIIANIDSFLALENLPIFTFPNPNDVTGIVRQSAPIGKDGSIFPVPIIELLFE